MLEIKNLSFSYKTGKIILDDISCSVRQGEFLGILGPNGTGKTTFVKCLNKILTPTQGDVLWNGSSIYEMPQNQVAKCIAYVPQFHSNFFAMNVVDTVMLGRIPYAGRQYSAEDKEIVFKILDYMNLKKFAFRNIKEMSGGERQRVYIARALAQQPKVIILDEPTSSLDLYNQLFNLHVIEELVRQNNITVIMTIHDLNLASMFCDNILMLKDSHIFAYGTTQEVLCEKSVRDMYCVNTAVTMEDGLKHVRLLKELN